MGKAALKKHGGCPAAGKRVRAGREGGGAAIERRAGAGQSAPQRLAVAAGGVSPFWTEAEKRGGGGGGQVGPRSGPGGGSGVSGQGWAAGGWQPSGRWWVRRGWVSPRVTLRWATVASCPASGSEPLRRARPLAGAARFPLRAGAGAASP